MKITELDRRPQEVRREDIARRENRARLRDKRRKDWERGFAAALELVAASSLARGTRDLYPDPDAPTAPYPVVDLDLVED